MYLPNELVVAILKNLERNHLKSARLVCQTWCSYASVFLFDQIYVAPNKVDLEVFDAITQHPTLSKCVRRLIYDGSEFVPDLTMKNYIHGLWIQMAMISNVRDLGQDNSDPQIRDWILEIATPSTLSEAIVKWQDCGLVNRGYRVYQDHSDYQQKALQSGDFIESLVQGLSRLVCLESVSLDGGWFFPVRISLGKHLHGSPLARRWDPFHCGPHMWSYESMMDGINDAPDGVCHYWIIITALFRAQRHINKFTIGKNYLHGISPEVFDRSDCTTPNALGLDIAALSGIKQLYLRLADYEDGSAPENCPNVEGLPKLLGSMHSLQRLHLDLPCSPDAYIDLYSCEKIFPQAMTWNNLEKLYLNNLASSATNLLSLFLIQMPHLKQAEIGEVQLSEGYWQGVIECLRQYKQSTVFEFDGDSRLYHNGEEILDCESVDIEEYIMNGGRHPCLSEDQPASASEAYMLKIDASLRDRLRESKSSRNHVSTKTSR